MAQLVGWHELPERLLRTYPRRLAEAVFREALPIQYVGILVRHQAGSTIPFLLLTELPVKTTLPFTRFAFQHEKVGRHLAGTWLECGLLNSHLGLHHAPRLCACLVSWTHYHGPGHDWNPSLPGP